MNLPSASLTARCSGSAGRLAPPFVPAALAPRTLLGPHSALAGAAFFTEETVEFSMASFTTKRSGCFRTIDVLTLACSPRATTYASTTEPARVRTPSGDLALLDDYAKDLRAADDDGLSDPYCVVTPLDHHRKDIRREKRVTRTISKTLNPDW